MGRPGNTAGDMKGDEAAVRALYGTVMDGWNHGNGAAFAAPFEDDADFVGFDGSHFKGRREIIDSHQPLFDGWLKGTRLVGEVRNVRFLAADVALMHATGGTIMKGKTERSPERESIQTLVARKHDGEWRLAAFQNTRIRPIGRNASGTFIWLFSDWLWKWLRPKS
jgi:uncharacterized protein (TIGR02246 family)